MVLTTVVHEALCKVFLPGRLEVVSGVQVIDDALHLMGEGGWGVGKGRHQRMGIRTRGSSASTTSHQRQCLFVCREMRWILWWTKWLSGALKHYWMCADNQVLLFGSAPVLQNAEDVVHTLSLM